MLAAAAVILITGLIAVVAAVAAVFFIDGAAYLAGWRLTQGGFWWATLPPVAAGVVCAVIARYLPGGIFIGLADTVLLVQRNISHRFRHHLLSTAAAFASLVGGASVGQYGPIAHLGGVLGALARRGVPPRVAAACGAAAAIAAAFNAPITAVVFAHEVVLRHYSLRAFTPVVVSAVVGYSVSAGLFSRPVFLQVAHMSSLHPVGVVLFVVAGVLFGLLAVLYLRGIFFIARKTAGISFFYKLPLAGLVSGLLVWGVPAVNVGDRGIIEAATAGLSPPLLLIAAMLVAKAAATLLCLGAGFAGGVVSPTLAIGALSGLLFFQAADAVFNLAAINVPATTMVLCGMMALTAPVIGAPLTGILFVMELSGSYPNAIAAAVAVAVAVQTAAKLNCRSYYDRQLGRRGFDMRCRYDEWRLQTTPLSSLLTPPPVVLPPTATVTAAVAAAVEKQTTVVYVADEEGFYIGALPLARGLATDGGAVLATVAESRDLFFQREDSIDEAMKQPQRFIGENAAVLAGRRLVGVVNKGNLLRAYNDIVHDYRNEEMAV